MNQKVYDDEIDIREYIEVVIKRWKILAIAVLITTLFAWIYTSMQKPVFEAKATILMRGISSSSLSQYSNLAGVLGINLPGGGNSTADILELMKSRAVAAKVLDDLKLTKRIKGWDASDIGRSDLASAVSGMIKAPKIVGNVVEIKAEANEPQLAADMVNAYIHALGYYCQELNYSEAQNKLRYIQAELPRVEQNLKQVENKLRLAPRSSAGYVIAGQGTVQRDYEIYSSVYAMLRKELESTKLETSKESPPFSIIDPSEKPKSKIRPREKVNILLGVVFGLFLGVFGAFSLEYWEKISNK